MFIIEALHWDQGSSTATPLNSFSGDSHFNSWPPWASPEGRPDDYADDIGGGDAGGDDAGGGDAVVSNNNIEADADNAEGKIDLGIVLAKCLICSSSLVFMFSQIHPWTL